MEPLLTQAIMARNDNYLGNFKQRLELAVNYTCHNVERSGNLASYELLICDWNSDTPLRQALNLNQAALKCTSFLEVPPTMVSRLGLGARAMHMAVAINVPVRRARGEFIMVTPADALFPLPSLAALFALLRGEAEFPADVKNCYLAVERYLVPWQASERLRLPDLDRYFLLHTPHMSRDRFHGVAAGEGAHVLSRKLWHMLRGLNDNYPGWGFQDVDLGRRAAQFVPQLKASFAAVYCYDLQQRPRDREEMELNANKDVVSLTPTVNDCNWGLAQEDIPRVPAEFHPEVNNAAPPPLPFDNGDQKIEYSSAVSRRTLYQANPGLAFVVINLDGLRRFISRIGVWLLRAMKAEGLRTIIIEKLLALSSLQKKVPHKKRKPVGFVVDAVFKFCGEHWAAQENKIQKPPWFCGEWFGERGRLLSFLAQAWRERLYLDNPNWNFRSVCLALAVLATVGRQRPGRFFHAPGRYLSLAQFAAFVDPTLEITGYDHWRGMEDKGCIVDRLRMVNFLGYYHLETGPLETAFERLKNTPLAGEPYQCLALDLDFLQPLEPRLFTEIAPLLAESCTMIIGGGPEKREGFGSVLLKEGFEVVGLLPGVSIYMRK